MKTQNHLLHKSFYCLQQPATIFSIFVLLFNDHYLKVNYPSWLTGKLSDFAGLFFFPFIVTATLGIVLGNSKVNSRKIGIIAFGIVGTVFFLLKMSKGFNLLFGNAIGNLLGHPVQYIMDSTDIAALVVLLPAWKMWNAPRNTPPHRLAWIALTIGSLASLATSPALPQIEQVEDFIYHNDILYAADSDQTPQFIAVTEDLGKNWETLYEYEDQGLVDEIKPLVKPQEFPVMACDPNNIKLCYRIERGDHVEVSTDAGANWETAWELPGDRLSFIKRKGSDPTSIKTYDLIILNQDNTSVLLVALGSEGVLRHELPNGIWERIGAGDADPTPYHEENYYDAFDFVAAEYIVITCLSLLYFTAMFGWNLDKIKGTNPIKRNFYAPILVYLVIVFPISIQHTSMDSPFFIFSFPLALLKAEQPFSLYALLFLFYGTIILASIRINMKSLAVVFMLPILILIIQFILIIIFPIFTFYQFYGPVFIYIYILIAWFGLRKNIEFVNKEHLWMLLITYTVLAILMVVPATILFVLWALGVIPRYEMTILYVIVNTIIIGFLGFYISKFFQHPTSEKE